MAPAPRRSTRSTAGKRATSPSPPPPASRRSAAGARSKSQSKSSSSTSEAPHYEFGGPIGALGIVVGLPLVCYGLVAFCNENGCVKPSELRWPIDASALPSWPRGVPLFSVDACLVFLGWMAFTIATHLILPGAKKQGVVLPNGERLTYKLNGLSVFVATAACVGVGVWSGRLHLGWVHANFAPLLTAGVAFAFALSLALYVGSFVGEKKLLAKGGDSGNALYDFFIGRELNPRLLRGAFDLKVFCELTPGLIGWLLLDLGFAHQQFLNTGRVSPAMALVCAFQGIYVLDALWFEPAILTTMDVTTDGFGFMLAFGDLVWVPFTYSLQARYILENDVALEPWFVCLVVTIKIIGYVVFRGSNGEKNRFRQNPNDPSVKHLKYLPTARGTRLLISGWWGMARHINYFGDWLMAWAWCLPCGFRDVVPYFYVVYFGVLLVHRDQRDQEACREKYGKDWDAYCAIVRWRFCPYVY
jgi:protein-S-isoprenylcysteine O-methyltransferase Ste14